MKNYISTMTILALALSSNMPSAVLAGNSDNNAKPSSSRVQGATHHFDYNVQKVSLTEISILLLKDIKVGEVVVKDKSSGKTLKTQVNMSPNKVTLVFPEAVAANTKLGINLKMVETPGYPQNWNYELKGKIAGSDQEIPFGSAQIQTDD